MGTRKIWIGILLWIALFLWPFSCRLIERPPEPETETPQIEIEIGPEPYAPDEPALEPEPVKIREPTIRENLMATFQGEIGVRQTGDNTGPRVDQYLAAVGLGPGYPWCGAFVGWGYRQHDLPIPQGAAWSPSWFPESKQIRNQDIQPGDVGGIYYSSLGRIGHVFVYDQPWDSQRNMAVTIEGNTNDTGGRTGHTVLRKYRDKNQIYKSARWIPEQTNAIT